MNKKNDSNGDKSVAGDIVSVIKKLNIRSVMNIDCKNRSGWQKYVDWNALACQYTGYSTNLKSITPFSRNGVKFHTWEPTVRPVQAEFSDMIVLDKGWSAQSVATRVSLFDLIKRSGARYIITINRNKKVVNQAPLDNGWCYDWRFPELMGSVVSIFKNTDFDTTAVDGGKKPIHDAEYYHNKYVGKRCFIIASGPSVNEMDLDWLRGEITIGVNQSHLAIPFDPTYIAIVDSRLWFRVTAQFSELSSEIICCTSQDNLTGADYPGDNLGFVCKQVDPAPKNGFRSNMFHYDLNKRLEPGWNVLFQPTIPFALWCGFSEIYLIGCDCTENGRSYDGDTKDVSYKQEIFTNYIHAIYALPSCLKKLNVKSKIFNAGVGGKLEAFPRIDFDSLKHESENNMKVVGYWTGNKKYQELAGQMRSSAEKFGFDVEIHNPELLGNTTDHMMNWVLNCSLCPFVVKSALEKDDRDVWFLDADAVVVKRPAPILDINEDFDCAFVYHYQKNGTRELMSNSMLFRNTDASKRLVKNWCDLQTQRNNNMRSGKYLGWYHEAWDQRTLQDCVENAQKEGWLKVVELPRTMSRLEATKAGFELMPDVAVADAFVTQHQASREMRHIV